MPCSRRRPAPNRLSLLLGDVDTFKLINDSYGHSDGDRCLRQVAQAIDDTVRRADSCFRWGGDEFAVLLTTSITTRPGWIARRLEPP